MPKYNIRIHHGGDFVTANGGKTAYEGTGMCMQLDEDVDYACYFDLLNLCKEKIGVKKFEVRYNNVPGRSFTKHRKLIEGDADITTLVSCRDINNFVDVYVVDKCGQGNGEAKGKGKSVGNGESEEDSAPFETFKVYIPKEMGPTPIGPHNGEPYLILEKAHPSSLTHNPTINKTAPTKKKLTPKKPLKTSTNKPQNTSRANGKKLSKGEGNKRVSRRTTGKASKKGGAECTLVPTAGESDNDDFQYVGSDSDRGPDFELDENDYDDERVDELYGNVDGTELLEIITRDLREEVGDAHIGRSNATERDDDCSQHGSEDELNVEYEGDQDLGDSDDLCSLVGSDDEGDGYPEFNPAVDFGRDVKLTLGLKFPDNNVLRKVVRYHSIQVGYDYYFLQNDKTRVSLFCKDRCPCPVVKGKKKGCTCKSWDCYFKIHATKLKSEDTFQIKSLNLNHSCCWDQMSTKISPEYLADRYLDRWRADPTWSFKSFRAEVMRDTGVAIGYHKAWFALARAKILIYGVCSFQYKKVWDYVAAIKKFNPGSSAIVALDYTSSLERDEEIEGVGTIKRPPPTFQRMYICLDACKTGFLIGCRPLIGVDGCHLKGAYPGQCLVAVGKDGNNNIFPIAWAVVEVENKESWSWFLELLLKDLGAASEHAWTFMSDRQKGLLDALQKVTPTSDLRFCCRHIWANFKLNFPGKAFKDSFWNAARSATKVDFDGNMECIKMLSKDAHAYLNAIPAKHWSRHAFPTYCKWDMLLNNICESFNNVLRECRDKPILTMMEWMRRYVMKRINAKREGALTFQGTLTATVSRLLGVLERQSRGCVVVNAGLGLFEVDHKSDTVVVDLNARTCGCYKWDLTGIPCAHAYRCITQCRKNPIDFVHEAYSLNKFMMAYEGVIKPMPGMKYWQTTSFVEPGPPTVRKMPGRPSKKKRNPEAGEVGRKTVKRLYKPNKCSKCGQLNHNSRTCKNDPMPTTDAPAPVNKGGRPKAGGTFDPSGSLRKRRKRVKEYQLQGAATSRLGDIEGLQPEFMGPIPQPQPENIELSQVGSSATTQTTMQGGHEVVATSFQRPHWKP